MANRPLFAGNAVAIRGQIDYPEKRTIPVHGASCLSVNGGVSESKVGRKRFGPHLAFESASTRVSGSMNKAGTEMTTTASSIVTGLSVAGRLTVDTVEAALKSSHAVNAPETSVQPTRARIVNLRLDAIPVKVVIDLAPFKTCDTKAKIEDNLRQDSSLFGLMCHHMMSPKGGRLKAATLEDVNGTVFGTVVREIQTKHPDVEIQDNMIHLKDYGRIYVGEMLISSGRRRLTMLRVQLGSPVGGEAVCADVESNGSLIF